MAEAMYGIFFMGMILLIPTTLWFGFKGLVGVKVSVTAQREVTGWRAICLSLFCLVAAAAMVLEFGFFWYECFGDD